MLQLFATSGLINAVIAVAFGLLVISKNWRERSNMLFALMTVALAVWGTGYWMWLRAVQSPEALFWVTILSVGSVFIPVFFFHWVVLLLNKERQNHLICIGSYTAALFMSLFAFSPLFISTVSQKLYFPFWPEAGVLYTIYIFSIYIGLIAYTLFLLFREFISGNDALVRGRVMYILLGAILGFGGGFFNFLLWYDIYIPPYGTFLVSAFPFLLGYAALKHQLFSLKAIAAEILVFFISVVLLIEVVLSTSPVEVILRGVFFLTTAVAGYLLIRSVYREIEQREKIEELSNQKSEFMTFASHEIRNPITAMRGYASLIVDGTVDHASPEVKAVAQKILIGGNDVLNLIAQFLSKSKMELGQISYNSAPFDLGAAASAIADGYVPHAELRGLTLEKKIDAPHQYTIKADEGKVKEVIGNLIDNSLKYTVHGGVTVAVERHGVAVRLTISDTGVGIAPETLPHLFKKFSRADAQKVNLLGTGVGLYLAKTFIEAMGGRIWAESEGKDKGSRFILEFPPAV